jgi:hypothetical protein
MPKASRANPETDALAQWGCHGVVVRILRFVTVSRNRSRAIRHLGGCNVAANDRAQIAEFEARFRRKRYFLLLSDSDPGSATFGATERSFRRAKVAEQLFK